VGTLQIRPEQALAAFEAKMELDELAAYQHSMEQMILQPQKDFRFVIFGVIENVCVLLKAPHFGFQTFQSDGTQHFVFLAP
jgi:hypothetical protein